MNIIKIKYHTLDDRELCVKLKGPEPIIRSICHYFQTSTKPNSVLSHEVEVIVDPDAVKEFFLSKSKLISNCVNVEYKKDIFFSGGNISGVEYRYKRSTDDFYFEFMSGYQIRAVISSSKNYIEIVRLLRTLIRDIYEESDFVCFHAGAFKLRHDDSAVLVIGDSGTGKSSTVWAALKNGSGYISNDRVLVGRNRKGIHVSTYATSMRLGYGLVSKDKSYLKEIKLQRYKLEDEQDQSSFEDRLCTLGKDWGDKNKLELTPEELCRIHSVEYHHDSNVSAIVITDMNSSSSVTTLEKVSWKSVKDTIERNIYSDDPDYMSTYVPKSHVIKLIENSNGLKRSELESFFEGKIWILRGGIHEVSSRIKKVVDSNRGNAGSRENHFAIEIET